MVTINFLNNTKEEIYNWEKLAIKLINFSYKILKLTNKIEISIHFLDSDSALKINQEYREKNYIPDVLSFPVEMSKNEIEAIGYQEIGDLFICIEEAERKSVKYNHSMEEEVGFLFVHGFLHLLGFDHETNELDEKVMFDFQDKILKQNNINYSIKFIEEDYLKEGL